MGLKIIGQKILRVFESGSYPVHLTGAQVAGVKAYSFEFSASSGWL